MIKKSLTDPLRYEPSQLSKGKLSRRSPGDKPALLDELNTFAGEVIFIASVTGELWEIFRLEGERISAAFYDHRAAR